MFILCWREGIRPGRVEGLRTGREGGPEQREGVKNTLSSFRNKEGVQITRYLLWSVGK